MCVCVCVCVCGGGGGVAIGCVSLFQMNKLPFAGLNTGLFVFHG